MKTCLLFLFATFILIPLTSCNRSNDSGSQINYSGPAQCLANNNANLVENIVGGTLVDNTTVPSGKNTVAIILNSKSSGTILCTGTVVANNLILTAGHCFDKVDQNSVSPGNVIFADTYNSTSSATISCWQRPANYVPCSVDNSYNCILNDITWVKINKNASSFGYQTVSILSNPQTILPTETKWMLGFGNLNDSGTNDTKKYIVDSSTQPNPDILPSGARDTFNFYTFSNAYQQYLTVIGPNIGKGTCEGDSGGPVYVNRSGKYILAALTQGSNSLLSPHPTTVSQPYTFDTSKYATCNDGYGVYTTVGNYVRWITFSSGINVSTY